MGGTYSGHRGNPRRRRRRWSPSSVFAIARDPSGSRYHRGIFKWSRENFIRGQTLALARARAHLVATLCSPGIDRWIAAIHHRSRSSPTTPTRLQRPQDTYPGTPLSRDSHLASRTSASPGRVSFSGQRRGSFGWRGVTQSRVGRRPPSARHGQRHVDHLVLAAVQYRVTLVAPGRRPAGGGGGPSGMEGEISRKRSDFASTAVCQLASDRRIIPRSHVDDTCIFVAEKGAR